MGRKKVNKRGHEECRCIVCGRVLKNPESIKLQMGITCRRKVIGIARGEEKNLIVLARKHLKLYSDKQKKLFVRKEVVKDEGGKEGSQVSNR